MQTQHTIFKYDEGKRLLILIPYFLMIVFGFIIVSMSHLIPIIIGSLVLITGMFYSLNILLFKSLTITHNSIIKESYIIGKIEVKFLSLKTSAVKRIWTGIILFQDKNKSYFYNRLMIFEIFPIGNEGFKKIRNILIEEKIIEGWENGWNL